MPSLFFTRRRFSPIATRCGHLVDTLSARVRAYGDDMELTLKPDRKGTVPFCHACYAEMAVKCDHCSQAIFIDAPIVFRPIEEGTDDFFKIRPFGTIFVIGSVRYVVCCGRRKCMTGNTGVHATYHGTWVPGERWEGDGRWWGGPQLFTDAFEKLKAVPQKPRTTDDDYVNFTNVRASNDEVLRPEYLRVA